MKTTMIFAAAFSLLSTAAFADATMTNNDNSKSNGFRLSGPGVSKQTSVKGTGRSTWTLTLKKGKYLYTSIAHPKRRSTLSVT